MASVRNGCTLQLDKLPHEILVQIMTILDINSLKSVRLSCKVLQNIPNKDLFKTFHLYPHDDRFQDLVLLAQTDTVRRCVQSLVYDLRWANHGQLLIQRLQYRDLDMEWPPGPYPLDWSTDALVKVEDEMAIRGYLEYVFPDLPALTSIRVIDLVHPFSAQKRKRWSYYMAPDYYQRLMMRNWAVPPNYENAINEYASAQKFQPASVASCILNAARLSNISLVKIELEGITTTDIFGSTAQFHGPSLATLQKLSIDFGCVPRRRERAALARLPAVLSLCTSLRYLSLEFGALGRDYADFDSVHPYTQTSIMDDLFPEVASERRRFIHSPGLRTLDLRGLRCKESEFKGILQETVDLPCPNFMAFCSWDLTLLAEEKDGPKACLVRVIERLRSFRLYIVQLCGTLTNGQNQEWLAIPPPGEDTLCDRVHEYMMWQGDYDEEDAECPLDFAAVPNGERDVTVPVEDTEENRKWRGDESWRMGTHRDETGIWVPMEMMMYFDAGDTSSPDP